MQETTQFLHVNNTMPEQFSDPDKCRKCFKTSSKKCSRCRAVSYCSAECQRSDWSRHKKLCAPVVVRDLPGRGNGLVATKKLSMGDLIVSDSAVIRVEADIDTWSAGPEIQRQVDKLSSSDKEQFYSLTKMQKLLEICDAFTEAAGDDDDKLSKASQVLRYRDVTAIFYNNDITSEDDCKCLYLTLALLNHSCSPNSCWSQSAQNSEIMELRAIRDIEAGDEVVVNYVCVEGRFVETKTRQEMLLKGWNFNCQCDLCQQPGDEETAKSEIRKLQASMIKECSNQVELINWSSLVNYQQQIVEHVQQLSSRQILLPRECQSLANLSQLAR